MSERDPSTFPADVAAFLEAETRRPPRSREREDAVFARLARTVALGGPGGDGGGTPDGGGPPAAPSPIAGGAAGGLAKLLTVAGAAFVLGSAAGGVVVAMLRPAPAAPLTAAVPRVVMTVSVGDVAPSAPAPRAPDPESEPPVAAPRPSSGAPPPVAASSGAPSDGAGSLAAERALLEGARTAIKTGDAPSAIQRLDDHTRRFPNGQLVEEREALRVQALMSSGRAAEGRARADAFREKFPRSVFSPAVDAAVGAAR